MNASDRNRLLSSFFCTSTFRLLLADPSAPTVRRKISRIRNSNRPVKLRTHLKRYFNELETGYCNEYVYKNRLLQFQLLNTHCLSDTVVLDEFRIGGSIADFVLLNGEIHTFEIKSDLDNLDKLAKQIDDYRRYSSRITVVVSASSASRAERLLTGTKVGLQVFGAKSTIETVKEAQLDNEGLDHDVLFKTLRKNEYLRIIQNFFGEIPRVPNTKTFQTCLDLVRTLDVAEFQDSVRITLKQRNLQCAQHLLSPKIPDYLKHICYRLNPNDAEYNKLFRILDTLY